MVGEVILIQQIKDVIDPLIIEYLDHYPAMYKTFQKSYYEGGHVLRYEPNEGFYKFHYDNDGKTIKNRLLSVIIYLNDVEVGGETEFQYFNTPPVKARKGNVLIFPSGWMHTHKGNTPVSNSKYICVLWLREGQASGCLAGDANR